MSSMPTPAARLRVSVGVLLTGAVLTLAPPGIEAQGADLGEGATPPTAPERGWSGWLGQEYSRAHVVLGVWALHPFEPQFPEFEWTWGYGVKTRQWLLASFMNSYGRRGVIAAVERYWWVGDYGALDIGLGYRLGVVTGYDEELFELAERTPVLPFTGLLAWADVGPFSLNAFYAYRGITLEAGLSFR